MRRTKSCPVNEIRRPLWIVTRDGTRVWGRRRPRGGYSFQSNEVPRPWYQGSFRVGFVNTNYLDDSTGRFRRPFIRADRVVCHD